MKYQTCHIDQEFIALKIIQDKEYVRYVLFAPKIIVIHVVIIDYVLERDAMSNYTAEKEICR